MLTKTLQNDLGTKSSSRTVSAQAQRTVLPTNRGRSLPLFYSPTSFEQQTFGNQALLHALENAIPPAAPWTPDHRFYELLAHDLAYRDDLDGRYLYHPESDSGLPFLPLQRFGFEPLPEYLAVVEMPPSTAVPRTALVYTLTLHEDKSTDLQLYTLVPNIATAPRILVFRGTETKP